LKEKKKQRKSMLKELKKFVLKKQKIKNVLWLKYNVTVLRYSEKCTKLARM